MDPADRAEAVEQPEQAGGGQHHDGTKQKCHEPDLFLMRGEGALSLNHGVTTNTNYLKWSDKRLSVRIGNIPAGLS